MEFTPSGGGLITSKSGTLSGTRNSYTFSISGYSTVTVAMAGNETADSSNDVSVVLNWLGKKMTKADLDEAEK